MLAASTAEAEIPQGSAGQCDRAGAGVALGEDAMRQPANRLRHLLNGDLIAISEALDRLAVEHPRKAELVKLRYFAGLSHHDAAALLGVSTSTADNDWIYAKSWLRVELSGRRGSHTQ
jgi:DNA-directed RNA polymerase specialized sigma24 family protein